MDIVYTPIGYFRTPHVDVKGMPIQPVGADGIFGSIVVEEQFVPGLEDLDGFSHVIVLYHLHEIRGYDLTVTPFLDTHPHGIFATRSPKRPNPIGISVMRLHNVQGNTVNLECVDVLDGTPVIDIKPYVPRFDVWEAERVGWFAGKAQNATHHRSDGRFAAEQLASDPHDS